MEIKRLPAVGPIGRARAGVPPASGSGPELSVRESVGKILFLLPLLAWCGGEGRWSEVGSGSAEPLETNRCWQPNNSLIVSVGGRKTASGGVNVCVLYAVKRFIPAGGFIRFVLCWLMLMVSYVLTLKHDRGR